MNILWLTWKDLKHPLAGGAERVNEELAKRLAADGHSVTLLVGGFPGGAAEETVDGYRILRMGNRYTVYLKAFFYYRKYLRNWPDLVIDEINTVPFFGKYYKSLMSIKSKVYKVKNAKFSSLDVTDLTDFKTLRTVLFIHQLCREIWFYQLFFPLSIIGYLIEPVYLWLLSDQEVITVSESTKNDLMKYGFKAEKIHIISEGIELEPAGDLAVIKKFDVPTVLALGAVRPMKRTHHIVEAFKIAREKIPDLRLIVAGDTNDSYAQKIISRLTKEKIPPNPPLLKGGKESETPFVMEGIEMLGRVSKEKKLELMQRSHVIAVTSVKEGWGLIVTEANSQGTPAVGYDVDGLRDSILDKKTGLLTAQNTPEALAERIVELFSSPERYARLRKNAWEFSKEITFEKSYREFSAIFFSDK